MSTSTQKKETISFKELFTLHFLRALFKTVWLFFPAILFLLLALEAFWQLSQGKDLLVRTLEDGRIFGLFIIAEVFWTYITWYTCYIISKVKLDRLTDNSNDKDEMYLRRMLIQMPRFLAFSCLSIIILAFYKLLWGENMNRLFFVILGISPFIYIFIYGFWSRQADKVDDAIKYPTKESKIKYLNKYRHTMLIIFAGALVLIKFYHTTLMLMILLMIFQVGLVLLLVFKKKRFVIGMTLTIVNKEDSLAAKVKKRLFGEEEKFYTKLFIFVLIFGSIFYISTIASISFAVYIGSVPFIIFAFGVLLILGNTVSFLSVHYRINLHGVAFIIAFVVGLVSEPHKVMLPEKKQTANFYSNRQTLTDYFKNWTELHKAELADSAKKECPVYFILADGGASRSGYWAASAMTILDSSTNGKLTSNLFCLSGASGGSLGNATFFNLLRSRQVDSSITQANSSQQVQGYLKSDFLTYTIARMLSADVFRYILPLWYVHDRAAALADAMETGSAKESKLNVSMSTCFSEIITQKNQPYTLPILCINSTRMQDGLPTVISNISLNDRRFNDRVDLVGLLGEQRDIKISQAVVLGASFPYLSPAGRINDTTRIVKDTIKRGRSNYFVDGGYFDNSGSGVVSEMINILVQDTLYAKYKSKLKFYVLHATNSPQGISVLHTVNPLVNDLAAPVKTLVGAYGTQTIVNDLRLWNQLKVMYPPKEEHYIKLNLYDSVNSISYPMDWVISDSALNTIRRRLYANTEIKKLANQINSKN